MSKQSSKLPQRADVLQPKKLELKACPCGSKLDYLSCCGLYLNGQTIPQAPEALMRSRYTAYCLANIDYIKKTMQGKPLDGFNENEAALWSKSVLWLGLQIIKTQQEQANIGFVEFIASYLEKDLIKQIHEVSQFQLIDEHWFYIDGESIKTFSKKVARNALCPCGNKKKFKQCHGKIHLQ